MHWPRLMLRASPTSTPPSIRPRWRSAERESFRSPRPTVHPGFGVLPEDGLRVDASIRETFRTIEKPTFQTIRADKGEQSVENAGDGARPPIFAPKLGGAQRGVGFHAPQRIL